MQWRRAVKPLAWTLVACVLLTAGWAAFMITDPLASSRQDAVQDKLYHQWRKPAQDTAVRGGSNSGGSSDGSSGSAAHRSLAGGAPAHGQGGSSGTGQSGYTGANPDGIRPQTGQPFAMIRVPAFGKDWKFAIVQGTSLQQLTLGPGHVPGTGLPGERGNFVVAAHDITAGNPFMHLRNLHKPDKVLIYSRDHVYTYRVQTNKVVRYTKVSVMYPVPGQPRQAPTQGRITLITCTPVTLNFTPWRIVVTGELVKVASR
jgi:LPXTG-site transpeptidase (sortase) family protein